MAERKTKPNVVTDPRPNYPDLTKTTPEALAQPLLVPLGPLGSSLRKSARGER